MSTMQRIRQAIEASHQAIELTEFAKSLIDGRITRLAYCQYLGQMHRIHQQLEQALPLCPQTGKYWQLEMIRTPAIERDLKALGSAVELFAPLPATQQIVRQLQQWAAGAQYALLGCCYILEGSRMGSLMIGRALIKNLHLPTTSEHACPAGVEYHLQDATQTPRRVKQLKAEIDADDLSAACESELAMGACVFMDMLNDLYQQLPIEIIPSAGHKAVCPMHHLAELAKLKSA